MRNHQKGADITEFVGPLIKRLKLAKERVPENSEKIIDQISTEVVKARDILNSREKLDRELAGYFGKIERQIDSWIDHKLPREKASDLPKKRTIAEVGESSNTSYQMDEDSKFKEFMGSLDTLQIICLSSLGIIPEYTELKKRLVMYWWLVLFGPYYWEAKDLERGFSDLVDKNVLIPVYRDHNKVIDRFTIEPIFHKWLHGMLSKNGGYGLVSYEKRKEGIWGLYTDIQYSDETISKLLINLNQRYLNSKDIMDISREHFFLHVVQLGSWHHTETKIRNGVEKTGSEETKSEDHIEVDQTDFLTKLGGELRYLSLRGISGIVELPESIGKLPFLYILDLRACHNLEKLPQKPRSTLKQKIVRCASPKDNMWFEKLEVLDMSESYLLDHMPKWVCELSNLKVLKGFVVGGLGNKSQSCRIGELAKLNKLWKLSIRITIDMLSSEVFQGFNTLDSLSVLTITWGEKKYNKEIPTYSLPKNLEKLDIRCYPEADVSKLKNPEELTNLKRLYIRAGNLIKIPCHDKWNVEILRLRFLKKLVYPTDWEELRSSFKNLKYVEYVGCSRPKNFPNDGNNWHVPNPREIVGVMTDELE